MDTLKNGDVKRPIICSVVSVLILLVVLFLVPLLYKLTNMGDGSFSIISGQLAVIVPSLTFFVASEWALYFKKNLQKNYNGRFRKVLKLLPSILLVLSYLPFVVVITIPLIVYLLNDPANNYSTGNMIIFGVIALIIFAILFIIVKKIIVVISKDYRHCFIVSFINIIAAILPLLFMGVVFIILGIAVVIVFPFVLKLAFGLSKSV